ncbi:MAG: hypothetical protein KDA78_17215 [Planctomycetaceae bacterium]|nr:hypothetical protein [Planctomycetaceae bacterium]
MQEIAQPSDEQNGEIAPNMIPGDVVTGQDVGTQVARSSQSIKLLMAAGLFAFAGGWGYANQDDFRAAMGMKTRELPGCQSGGSCCSHAAMADDGSTTGCCHEQAMAEGGSCCAESQKSAMVAALLAGTENAPEEAGNTAADEQNAPPVIAEVTEENASSDGQTTESVNPETETAPAAE